MKLASSFTVAFFCAISTLGILAEVYGSGPGNSCCTSDAVNCAGCVSIGQVNGINLWVQMGVNPINRCFIPAPPIVGNCNDDLGNITCFNGIGITPFTNAACNALFNQTYNINLKYFQCTCPPLGPPNTACGCK